MLTNANASSSESKFAKGVSTPLPDNNKNDVFGLHNKAVAPVLVRAHVHPKMIGLKLLKDFNVKEHDVAENSRVLGLGDKVRQLNIDNRDPAMPSPPPTRVHSSSSGRNNVMTNAQGNTTYDTH